jgi:hypothetical protein
MQRLSDAYTWAVSEYLRLQTANVAAILNGDKGFEEEVHKAAHRKDEAKYALIAHREAHHCMD